MGSPRGASAARARRFHYTPKHASWLNMAEIEIGALSRQCLDRRFPDRKTLRPEVTAWQRDRNRRRPTPVDVHATGCRSQARPSLCCVINVSQN